ncbi:hypothetical protein BC829DRAFT_494224 [Chytridium lagenaria]|nr:hypothetical protein BC829DRAFT_494224 [Chytridium lagenaria]
MICRECLFLFSLVTRRANVSHRTRRVKDKAIRELSRSFANHATLDRKSPNASTIGHRREERIAELASLLPRSDHANEIVVEASHLRRSKVPISSTTMITFMNAQAALGNWHEVVGLFSEWNQTSRDAMMPTPRAVVKALSKLGQLKDAARMVKDYENTDKELAEMKEKGLKPSARVFAYLSVGFSSVNKSRSDLTRMYDEVSAHGIDPETNEEFILNSITAHTALYDIPNASERLNQLKMVSADEKRLLIGYSSLIDGKLKAGVAKGSFQAFNDAKLLLGEMLQHGVRPNVKTYTGLLHAYYRVGGLGRLLECLEDMKASGIRPDQHVYNILIRAYTLANKPLEAVSTYDEMIREGLAPNIRVLTSTIAALSVAGDINRMREVFNDVEVGGAQCDHALFHVMMNGYANGKDLTSCLEWYDRLLSSGLRPNVVTYTILMYAVAKSIDSEAMERWFEKLFSAEIKPNVYTYSLIMHEKSKLGELAAVTHIFEEMVDSGVSPTPVTYTILANAFLQNSLTSNALKTVHYMLSEGLRPDAVVFYTAMKVYLQTKNYSKVVNMYNRVSSFGLDPTDAMDLILFRTGLATLDYDVCQCAVNSVRERSLRDIGTPLPSSPTAFENIIVEVLRKKRQLSKAKNMFADLRNHAFSFKQRCLNRLLEVATRSNDVVDATLLYRALGAQNLLRNVPVDSRTALYASLTSHPQLLSDMVALSVMNGNAEDVDHLSLVFVGQTPSLYTEPHAFHEDMKRLCEVWTSYGSFLGFYMGGKGVLPLTSDSEELFNERDQTLFNQLSKPFGKQFQPPSLSIGSRRFSPTHPAAPVMDLPMIQALLDALATSRSWDKFLVIATEELGNAGG